MHITLTGFKASGKTTLGKALATLLQREFIDTDERLERLHAVWHGQEWGSRAIYTSLGEAGFRHLESVAVASLLWAQSAVVATGGGAILQEANRRVLRTCSTTVFVDTALPILQERLRAVRTPLFQEETLMAQYAQRRPLYLAAADIVFPITGEDTPEKLAAQLHHHLHEQNYA